MDSGPSTPLVGRTLGHYRVVRQIGSGGMGVVYEAEDLTLGRRVALKFVPETTEADPDLLARFRREAQIASRLNHPNICTIYSIEQAEGRDFITMELLEGSSLRDRIHTSALPFDEVLEIGIDICDALVAAHDKGIIHRDLKPANIWLTTDGHTKVLDYGIAKLEPERKPTDPDAPTTVEAGQLTSTGLVMGTAGYMAPEQARGRKVDARADIFSLGAVLYELATGTAPFAGETTAIVFGRLLNEQPTPVRELNAALPEEFEPIVQKALEKDPAFRYQAARDLRVDLKRLQRGTATGTEPRTAVPVPRARPKWAFLLLLLVPALAVALWKMRPARPLRIELQQLTNYTDAAMEPALSPDGRLLVFLRGTDERPTPGPRGELYLKLMPEGEPVALTSEHEPGAMTPAFSPDGSRVTFSKFATAGPWGFDTWIVPVIGSRKPTPFMPNAVGLSWVGDNRVLFSTMTEQAGTRVVTSTESRDQLQKIYEETGVEPMIPAVSPDRNWILSVEDDDHGWRPCRLVSMDGRSKRSVGPAGSKCLRGAWSPDGRWMYLSVDAGEGFHLWRQAFPDGVPEKLTDGPNEELGLAVAPDGKSLVTSIGQAQNIIWMQGAAGDRQISSEGFVFSPTFSPDGTSLFYLVKTGRSRSFISGELWRSDLDGQNVQKILPGFEVTRYDVSPDQKYVAFTAYDKDGHSRLWVTSLDRAFAPKRLSNEEADRPFFAGGRIFYMVEHDGLQFVHAVRTDGTHDEQVLGHAVLFLTSVSPDGQWVVTWEVDDRATSKDEARTNRIVAHPLAAGATEVHITDGGFGPANDAAPLMYWSKDGRFLHFSGLLWGGKAESYALALPPGKMMPEGLLRGEPLFTVAKQARVFHAPGASFNADLSKLVYTRRSSRRNLFRVVFLEGS